MKKFYEKYMNDKELLGELKKEAKDYPEKEHTHLKKLGPERLPKVKSKTWVESSWRRFSSVLERWTTRRRYFDPFVLVVVE